AQRHRREPRRRDVARAGPRIVRRHARHRSEPRRWNVANPAWRTLRGHAPRWRSLPRELASRNPRSPVQYRAWTVDHSTIGTLILLRIRVQTRRQSVRGSRPGVAVGGAHVDEELAPANEARLETKTAIREDGRGEVRGATVDRLIRATGI